MSTGNGLATDLMQLGITAQAAGYLGAGAYTTVAVAGTTQGAGTAITQSNTNVKATTAGGATPASGGGTSCPQWWQASRRESRCSTSQALQLGH